MVPLLMGRRTVLIHVRQLLINLWYIRSGYHGYWAEDIWTLNPAFGTEDDLRELAADLHARDMVCAVSVTWPSSDGSITDESSFQYLMVDVVTNHMGYMGCRSCVDYSRLKPFSSVRVTLRFGDYFTERLTEITVIVLSCAMCH